MNNLETENQINTGESMKGANIQMMSLNKIKLARNSRREIRDEDLSGIMQSIKQVGLRQPIGVSKNGDGYSICYGNRRFLACSKLGIKKIPVIIHNNKDAGEEDLKNLTENIQRRNISLAEAGRYIDLLQKSGIGVNEIAVRLGVERPYVLHAIRSYKEVPAKFRKDIEVGVTKTRGGGTKAGKIGVQTAGTIVNYVQKYKLDDDQRDYLFAAAKKRDKFNVNDVKDYAIKLASGSKDPVGESEKMHYIAVNLRLGQSEFLRLQEKYISRGPFGGMTALLAAIVTGKINERIKLIEAKTWKKNKKSK